MSFEVEVTCTHGDRGEVVRVIASDPIADPRVLLNAAAAGMDAVLRAHPATGEGPEV